MPTPHGENVWAYVAPRPGRRGADRRADRLRGERVGYKAPDVVVILDSLPVNAVGKTDRMALKRMAAETHHAHDVR